GSGLHVSSPDCRTGVARGFTAPAGGADDPQDVQPPPGVVPPLSGGGHVLPPRRPRQRGDLYCGRWNRTISGGPRPAPLAGAGLAIARPSRGGDPFLRYGAPAPTRRSSRRRAARTP